jgi:hypothetical protein
MKTLVTALLAGLLSVAGVGRTLADEDEFAHDHARELLPLEALPAPAQATLKAASKGGQIQDLRKKTSKDGTVIYKGEIVRDARGATVEVSADGQMLERGTPEDIRKVHDGMK